MSIAIGMRSITDYEFQYLLDKAQKAGWVESTPAKSSQKDQVGSTHPVDTCGPVEVQPQTTES